ncbi:MAG: zf-TFIIB domain-containing protein [Planctomycetia bacterium]|nr:zf-TFIIB domain-containing protein [Planctomycetia bacterium]
MPRCPGCFVPLTISNYGGVTVKTCNSCFGTWISRVSLMHLVRAADPPDAGPNAPSLQDLAALVIEGHNKRPFPCPECRRSMTMDRLHPMLPIEMQFCHKCSYVWLDVGKLAMSQRLYHALISSTNPKIIEIRERYALASLGMEPQKPRVAVKENTAVIGTEPAAGIPVSRISGGFDLNTLVAMLSQ